MRILTVDYKTNNEILIKKNVWLIYVVIDFKFQQRTIIKHNICISKKARH